MGVVALAAFADLTGSEWFHPDLWILKRLGLIRGYPGNLFYPPNCPEELKPLHDRYAVLMARLVRAEGRIENIQFEEWYDNLFKVCAKVERESGGFGSGVVVSPLFLLTNNHVTAGSNGFRVLLTDGQHPSADVVALDAANDLALLQLNYAEAKTWARIASEAPRPGDRVAVMGAPMDQEWTLSTGNVSRSDTAIRYFRDPQDVMPMNAPISPGSSGGPIFNVDSELVGLASAAMIAPGATNLAYGVPLGPIREFLDRNGII